jgi:hypothetical protein
MRETSSSERALEAKARRVAQRHGYIATKSRWRRDSIDNQGGFSIVDAGNHLVAGERWSMTPQEVIDWFSDD